MLLAVDVGNTNCVFAVFDGEELRGEWRMATLSSRTADEYAVLLLQFFHAQGIAAREIDGAILSTVVPETQFPILRMCERSFGVRPLLVGDPAVRLGMEVRLDQPEEVGADRLVNAVEAWRRYARPLVVVDFGTATTFDVVSADGAYLGGAIAPGVNLSLDALHAAAAKLPRIRVRRPVKVIGTSTISAMESGIYFGYIGLVDGIVRRIEREYGAVMKVIATGGLASLYAEGCETIEETVEDLTIRGLQMIYHRNQE
jgi:type III pantothenate kinase